MKTLFYICPICGNVILRVINSGVTPVCCNQPMQELKPNTIDASQEKHVPVITQLGKGHYRVAIGATPHPTTEEHHIAFIYLATEHGGQLRNLTTSDPASADFCDCEDPIVGAYAYCNLHGLWYSDKIQKAEGNQQPSDTCCKHKSCGKLTALLAMFFPFLACSCPKVDNTPVDSFNLNRYLGTWYEIARFDHWFERGMDNTIAEYTWDDNGNVKVTNSGWRNGDWKVSKGVAKTTDIAGLMRVSFFRPFYSDYRVLMIDKSYTLALVGSKTEDYLWILSRTPEISQEQKSALVAEANRRGYDTHNLIWVNQSHNKMWE